MKTAYLIAMRVATIACLLGGGYWGIIEGHWAKGVFFLVLGSTQVEKD